MSDDSDDERTGYRRQDRNWEYNGNDPPTNAELVEYANGKQGMNKKKIIHAFAWTEEGYEGVVKPAICELARAISEKPYSGVHGRDYTRKDRAGNSYTLVRHGERAAIYRYPITKDWAWIVDQITDGIGKQFDEMNTRTDGVAHGNGAVLSHMDKIKVCRKTVTHILGEMQQRPKLYATASKAASRRTKTILHPSVRVGPQSSPDRASPKTTLWQRVVYIKSAIDKADDDETTDDEPSTMWVSLSDCLAGAGKRKPKNKVFPRRFLSFDEMVAGVASNGGMALTVESELHGEDDSPEGFAVGDDDELQKWVDLWEDAEVKNWVLYYLEA